MKQDAIISDRVEADRRLLRNARERGKLALFGAFVKLSGPGWLQSAITLGSGSMAGALFLGVLGGYSLLWLQLMAISFGVIMLSAISYVTLSTGERPFHAINRHINPVLGWGWALATLAANIVWCLPQFGLATAAAQQNLLPGLLGAQSELGVFWGRVIISAVLLCTAIAVVWQYDRGGWGIKLFEGLLKAMVGLVVLSFFGVVVMLSIKGDGLPWSEILRGFIPDFRQLTRPAATLVPYIEAVPAEFQSFWRDRIVSMQQSVIIAAAATAVGINMTFLLPYSMLSRGWDRNFRGMAIFDLGTGMAVPYVLVTSCVVIASANRFHEQPEAGLLGAEITARSGLAADYESLLRARFQAEISEADFAGLSNEDLAAGMESLPEADKRMAAMLVKRDADDLAESLTPLTGSAVANVIFGIGVFGMGLSTIIILMLISGFVVCEILGLPQGGAAHRWGCLLPAVGVFGPFFWSQAQAWLAVPTSVFGMTLLPIAYFTFFFMMNQKSLLGNDMPTGAKRIWWNLLMALATVGATAAASVSIWNSRGALGWYGVGGAGAFIALAVLVQMFRGGRATRLSS